DRAGTGRLVVEDRAAEQAGVGPGHRAPGGAEGVPGPVEEVADATAHLGVCDDDEDRGDHQRSAERRVGKECRGWWGLWSGRRPTDGDECCGCGEDAAGTRTDRAVKAARGDVGGIEGV